MPCDPGRPAPARASIGMIRRNLGVNVSYNLFAGRRNRASISSATRSPGGISPGGTPPGRRAVRQAPSISKPPGRPSCSTHHRRIRGRKSRPRREEFRRAGQPRPAEPAQHDLVEAQSPVALAAWRCIPPGTPSNRHRRNYFAFRGIHHRWEQESNRIPSSLIRSPLLVRYFSVLLRFSRNSIQGSSMNFAETFPTVHVTRGSCSYAYRSAGLGLCSSF